MPSSIFLVCTIVLLLALIQPAHAFGAGNIPSYAALEGKAFRHGDLEDVLAELVKRAGGAASMLGFLGAGKFGGLDIKRVYFGNWLRDYSQAMDVAGLSKLSAQAIINLVAVLGFLAHGYATGEFEVTEERLGVYLPTEHIDNPKGYNDNKDARQVHPGLRPPIDPQELEIDQHTGMKNYIANERGHWQTSSGLVRQRVMQCIDLGRRARSSGRDADLHEAYRMLGCFLHTLEDLPAHSNYIELALMKMGHHQVFCHVGDHVKVRSHSGPVPPLVTGTFGGSDFMHSLLGEASDHISEASVTELNNKIAKARSSPSDTTADGLRDMIFQIPGTNGQQLSREMDNIQQMQRAGPSKDPSQMTPKELHDQLWKVLSFRDHVCMAIESGIEKVPGLSSLVERITDSINKFVLTTLEPYIKPIMQQAVGTIQQGSAAVVNNEDQFEVWNSPMASDPTHSMLSKDHFGSLLNEPAGKMGQVIVRFAVTRVVKAWDDQSIDPRHTADQICSVFHHPFFADSRSEIHTQMFGCVQKWFQEGDQRYILAALTKESVRAHKNVRKGHKAEPHSHSQSFLPPPDAVYGAATNKIQGYVNQAAQQVPGYSTYQSLMNQPHGGRRDVDSQGGEASSYYSGTQPAAPLPQHHQPQSNYGQSYDQPQTNYGQSYDQPAYNDSQQYNNTYAPPQQQQHYQQPGGYQAPAFPEPQQFGQYGAPPPGPPPGQFGMPEPQHFGNPPPPQQNFGGFPGQTYQQNQNW